MEVNKIIEESIKNGEIEHIIDRHTSAKLETPPSAKPETPPSAKLETPKPSITSAISKTHSVVKWDSLERVADIYYGKASLWNIIYKANKDTIPPTHILKNGARLKIPNLETSAESHATRSEIDIHLCEGLLNHRNTLEYITYLYKKGLISKDIYDEIYEKGKKIIVESQLFKLKEDFSNNLITKEVYQKEQLALLRELF